MKTATKERPILFSAPMVRAILDGRKTETRRVVKPIAGITDRDDDGWPTYEDEYGDWHRQRCPYGQPGDRLYVKETWAPIPEMKPAGYFTDPKWVNRTAWYAADNDRPTWGGEKWRPSIHMPRWASRITLEVTDVRVERVQEISEADAIAEGSQCPGFPASVSNRGAFAKLWDSINAKRGYGWDSNPWVWVVSFRRIDPEVP